MNIDKVRIDGQTQPRVKIDLDAVADYAEVMAAGEALPPLIVFHDGADYWLADGFHRYHAAKRIGMDTLEVQVIDGDRRQAVLYSVGANSDHGLRRTGEDKRKAVLRLLEDAKWAKWSNAEIARRCRVGDTLVGEMRRSHSLKESEPPQAGRTYTTKHGTTATMKTEKIGRPKTSQVRRVADPDICQPDSDEEAQGTPSAAVSGSSDDSTYVSWKLFVELCRQSRDICARLSKIAVPAPHKSAAIELVDDLSGEYSDLWVSMGGLNE